MTPLELKLELQGLVDGTSPRLDMDTWRRSAWAKDPEVGHSEADDLLVFTLRGLGYGEAMDIYEAQTRWMA